MLSDSRNATLHQNSHITYKNDEVVSIKDELEATLKRDAEEKGRSLFNNDLHYQSLILGMESQLEDMARSVGTGHPLQLSGNPKTLLEDMERVIEVSSNVQKEINEFDPEL